MTKSNLLFSILAAFSAVIFLASPVFAGEEEYKETVKEVCTTGQYGDKTCTKEVERERVKGIKDVPEEHRPKPAGLADVPFAILASVFGVMTVSAFALSKVTKSVYWLE